MTQATLTVSPPPTAPTPNQNGQRFVLHNLTWADYESIQRMVGDRRVFITYNRGTLELMSPSFQHESHGRTLAQIVRILAEELDVPIKAGGSTTFRRQDLDRGLEPDECFYTRNAAVVAGLKEIDLSVHPPPDLAIEVEISHRLVGRVDIYRDLGVPELWRDDGHHVRIFTLEPGQTYVQRDRSPTFPAVPIPRIEEFLAESQSIDDTTWTRRVRKWVRDNVLAK